MNYRMYCKYQQKHGIMWADYVSQNVFGVCLANVQLWRSKRLAEIQENGLKSLKNVQLRIAQKG